jgi:hypothetical protein
MESKNQSPNKQGEIQYQAVIANQPEVRKTMIRTTKTNFYFWNNNLPLIAASCKIISEEILGTLQISKLMDTLLIQAVLA